MSPCPWRLACLVLFTVRLWGADYTVEVRNGSSERDNAVVSQPVTREWAASCVSYTLVETADGRAVPVPCGVDASGEAPVLFWMLSGKTAPGAVRRFAWVPETTVSAPASDLRVTAEADAIAVENGFFRLKHPARGGGGFPYDITYAQSGHADLQLYFLDRIVRPQGGDGRLAQYCARDCADAETRVVYQSPLRVTLEARTGFGKKAADTPGNPQAVYRYTYTAFSPVVEVSARYEREDDGPWRELHFLHLTRQERRYSQFVAGDAAATYPMQAKGTRSRSITGPQWAVMSDGDDACGAGFDGAVCWDASDQFVYYIRSGHATWEGPSHRFDGGLYFGPAKEAAWYGQWLGRERSPEIRLFRDGKPWVPVEREALNGAFELKNDALRMVFDTAENGFACLGIENRLAEDARFVRTREDAAGLWSLTFKAPPDASGKQESVELNDRSPAPRRFAERSRRGLAFVWQGLDLPGEPGVVDVRAEVRLDPGEGASAWRIRVANRSRRYGLWETSYPLLRGVVQPGVGDALLPYGNWGGSLLRRHRNSYEGGYPSARCPLQMCAFNLGEAGLYLAAHDGASRTKRLVVTREQDVSFRLLAENAGVPGAAGAPDYPAVIAAYRGDWWEAARLYRAWATRQAWAAKGPIRQRDDYPRRLADLGFWMLLGGAPAGVTNLMAETARLYPDVPVGVHWYSWHQIPFDNSYPEYFPAKEGVAEATLAMTRSGQTVMPYINARLWDQDIPSFPAAFPAACKQPAGTNYVETYGSGRNLVPMCPAAPLWQSKVAEICHRLISECGVNAVYLDQIGAAAPAACHDASHGHPTGGGRHWTDGYRTMLTPIRAEASRAGAVLTTENTAEPYMDTIDAYLAWNPRHQEDVPLLPAVYSGYTVYFTSPQAAQDSLDAFCAAQARDFLWGCQLGWNGDWILREPHREKQRFQHALCRCRLAAKDFMVYGQFVDEIRPLNNVPEVTHQWHRTQPHTARLPAVMGTVWRDDRGRLAVFVVNTSGVPQKFDFQIEPQRWLKSRGPWRLSTLTPEGENPVCLAQDRGVCLGDLQPREIRGFVLTPR
ncbi:MAG TPA: DUF6259 domain-containing protein [Kiritimatiellia bacterium]|nr:DUF6259 domain-containing protein [Kiritimatiellia bacterium]HPS09317.1 DUF6259 domain-containing protein [Kiritimatiellia bacterium]